MAILNTLIFYAHSSFFIIMTGKTNQLMNRIASHAAIKLSFSERKWLNLPQRKVALVNSGVCARPSVLQLKARPPAQTQAAGRATFLGMIQCWWPSQTSVSRPRQHCTHTCDSFHAFSSQFLLVYNKDYNLEYVIFFYSYCFPLKYKSNGNRIFLK